MYRLERWVPQGQRLLDRLTTRGVFMYHIFLFREDVELGSSADHVRGSRHVHGSWYQRLLGAAAEENGGVKPVPVEKRANTQYNNPFTVHGAVLCIPAEMLATPVFEMGHRDAFLNILFFSSLRSIPPASHGVWTPKSGLRQLIEARYPWGFALVASIVSGQTITAISSANVNITVGIVVNVVLSFVVSLLGYMVLHIWERYQLIPNLAAICGKYFQKSSMPSLAMS
ncbi:Uu.00g017010.m01.CDS01 [Anthostomella pinea]|uniref:Uu.00g017010.m01.CDS01 n=1 Tax=Anthostomella pinea TaxID=933095 RepID=A0AAI8VYU6_9PEZI|nr:Uu.00g017010.m01.CDS01 [Anthostomella pinea]